MHCLKIFALLALLALVGAAVFIWLGIYNVAATSPHWPITRFVLHVTRDRSIAAHAATLQPPDLSAPGLVEKGARHFEAMCRQCHGAPGHLRDKFAQGMNPLPPDPTSEMVQGKTDREIYWVMANGLKSTGMPAFGLTHNPGELNAVLALVRRLPALNAQDYDALAGQDSPARTQQPESVAPGS